MIWFKCKKCDKPLGRPDNSAGAVVFCDCGQGNTVPWESSISEPTANLEAPPLDLEPISFQPEPTAPSKARKEKVEDKKSRKGRIERRDPAFCFNHQQVPTTAKCADCGESFCDRCVVSFQGNPICSPCKNYRTRKIEMPPTSSPLARTSVLLAILASPLALCTVSWVTTSPTMRMVSLLSLIPQLTALAMGIWALLLAERERKVAAEAWAITGITTSGLMLTLTVLLNYFANRLLI